MRTFLHQLFYIDRVWGGSKAPPQTVLTGWAGGNKAAPSLRTSPAVNPRWDDGIVTLPVPHDAPDKPLHLRMELWDVPPEEQPGATPIGVAEASLEHEAGRLYNHDLQGGPGGDTISFSFRIGTIVHVKDTLAVQ